MIQHANFTVTDYGASFQNVLLGYVEGTYALARYAIVNSYSTEVIWTNDPKFVEADAIQFARKITSTTTTP